MPSMLLLEKGQITMIGSSPEGKVEFVKEPKDGQLMNKLGNLTHPTDRLLCLKKLKPIDMDESSETEPELDSDEEKPVLIKPTRDGTSDQCRLKFKQIDTQKLTALVKKVRSTSNHPVTLLQKEIRNFDRGGKLLCVYFNRGKPLLMEVAVRLWPNFQKPLPVTAYDPEDLYKFKIRKVDLKGENNREYKQAVNVMDQITKAI